jgi:hypothetical protein
MMIIVSEVTIVPCRVAFSCDDIVEMTLDFTGRHAHLWCDNIVREKDQSTNEAIARNEHRGQGNYSNEEQQKK